METFVDLPKFNQEINNAKQRFSLTNNTGSMWDCSLSVGQAERELQLYRFFKKFSIHDPYIQSALTTKALSDYRKSDRDLDDAWASIDTTEFIRANAGTLRHVRAAISSVLVRFKVKPEDYDFGPGESYIPSKGDVSILAKLSTHEWTVTRGCAEAFLEALYLNRATRRLAWCRYEDKLSESGTNRKFRKARVDGQSALVFFKRHIFCLLKFVSGNRFSTVDKDNSKRRPISVEPLGNIYVQKGYGNALKRALSYVGIDLYQGQDIHRNMISDYTKSTIDFSNASDSIHVFLCKLLFPAWFYDKIFKARSPICEITPGEYIKLNKLSSMGNGFTFEILTLVLWSFCKACGDEFPLVYGDDVIIKNECVDKFINTVVPLGFAVNETKSFTGAHPIRESCGAFCFRSTFTDDYGALREKVTYLLSFDIEQAKNDVEAIAVLNKLYLMRSNGLFRELWSKLVLHVHEDVHGPVPDCLQGMPLDKYVFNPNYKPKITAASQWIAKAYQVDELSIHVVKSPKSEMLTYDWRKTTRPNMVKQFGLKEDVARVLQFTYNALRLKNLMEPHTHIRQNAEDMDIKYITLFVGPNGPIMTGRQYKNWRDSERNYIADVFCVDPKEIRKEHWGAWHFYSTL